ncbi:hypothetical protein Tco_0887655, partial [Tanacetum coccineum]
MSYNVAPAGWQFGLRMADSHTGNHPEDDFTPLKTIRRSCSVIREKVPLELEGETFEGEEFNDFPALYPVPSEYCVILPKSNQTVFDALPGYAGLYTHSFSLANLRLPLTEFFCELMVVSPLSNSSEGSLICVEMNPMFQHLSRYPTSVRVFPDPILFLAGLKPSWEHGQQRPAIMADEKGIYLFCFLETDIQEKEQKEMLAVIFSKVMVINQS